jgi:hypothetical protein
VVILVIDGNDHLPRLDDGDEVTVAGECGVIGQKYHGL